MASRRVVVGVRWVRGRAGMAGCHVVPGMRHRRPGVGAASLGTVVMKLRRAVVVGVVVVRRVGKVVVVVVVVGGRRCRRHCGERGRGSRRGRGRVAEPGTEALRVANGARR
jgi:hypothetical protein